MAATKMQSTAGSYFLLAPSLFGVVTFLLMPMLVVAWPSLHRWDLLGPIQYVGLSNWRSVLTDPSFATSLLVTALFIAIVVPTQSVLGRAAVMAASGSVSHALRPYFDEMFLGRADVATTLRDAQAAANAAAQR